MPTLYSHTITHNLIVFNGVRECFAFAKPHKQTLQPKLDGSVCLSNSITKTTDKPTDEEEHRTHNTGNRCTTLYFSKESLKPKKLNLF